MALQWAVQAVVKEEGTYTHPRTTSLTLTPTHSLTLVRRRCDAARYLTQREAR